MSGGVGNGVCSIGTPPMAFSSSILRGLGYVESGGHFGIPSIGWRRLFPSILEDRGQIHLIPNLDHRDRVVLERNQAKHWKIVFQPQIRGP